MNGGPNGQDMFHVSMSGLLSARLKQLTLEAAEKGEEEKVVDAFRRIVQRLERDPEQFGETSLPIEASRLDNV